MGDAIKGNDIPSQACQKVHDIEMEVDDQSKMKNEDDECFEFEGFHPSSLKVHSEIHTLVKKLEAELRSLESTPEVKTEPVEDKHVDVPTAPKTLDNVSSDIKPDLNRPSSPSGSSSSLGSSTQPTVTPSIPQATSSIYHIPFQKGWKREVVLKEGEGADVIYIHPSGARMKNLREVHQNLTEGLTADNFLFKPDVLNAGVEFETVIKAAVVASSIRKSGRVPVPSSNYKIVERMEEESRKRASQDSPNTAPPKREKLVLKLSRSGIRKSIEKPKKSSSKSAPDNNRPHGVYSNGSVRVPTPSSPRQESVSTPDSEKKVRHRNKTDNVKFSRSQEENGWHSTKKIVEGSRIVCNIDCPKAMGLIPTLQCGICLCLYHPECVDGGLSSPTRQTSLYVCKSCKEKAEVRKQGLPPEPAQPAPALPLVQHAPVQHAPVQHAPVQHAPVPSLPPPPVAPAVCQTVVTVNRRRFILVPNLMAAPVAAATPATLLNFQQPVAASPAPAVSVQKTESAVLKSPKGKFTAPPSSSLLLQNLSHMYLSLFHIFKYLTVQELLCSARVCRLWESVATHQSLWRTVRMKNSQVKDWDSFVKVLSSRKTHHLDLRKMIPSMEDTRGAWLTKLCQAPNLRELDVDRATPRRLQSILLSCPWLTVCNAQIIKVEDDDSISLDIFTEFHQLKVLRIRYQEPQPLPLSGLQLTPLARTLQTLSLLSFSNWSSVDIDSLQSLSLLVDLELGDCTSLPSNFPELLKPLKKLERLRLEKADGGCPTTEIINTLSGALNLQKLELINFEIRAGFDTALANLHSLQTLLVIPDYTSMSATSISTILRGIYQLRESLTTLIWVFTAELLNITELYADKHRGKAEGTIVNPIIVMKPIPLPKMRIAKAMLWEKIEMMNESESAVAVLPLDEVREMLTSALPKTKIHAIRLPSQSTSRQTIQDLLA